jgi:hypothetical protein
MSNIIDYNEGKAQRGIIDIEYIPTHCRFCDKLLVRTFMEKGDLRDLSIYIMCKDCIKVFPEIIQEKLKK